MRCAYKLLTILSGRLCPQACSSTGRHNIILHSLAFGFVRALCSSVLLRCQEDAFHYLSPALALRLQHGTVHPHLIDSKTLSSSSLMQIDRENKIRRTRKGEHEHYQITRF
eukprot:scaffold7082_cov144-Skeletonema_marinoi.AAC.2